MTVRGGEEAASSLVAFIVAGTVFIGSIGAILYTTDQVEGSSVGEGSRTASLKVQANSLASILLESPGLTTSCTSSDPSCQWSFECVSATAQVTCTTEARARDQARAEALTRLGLEDPANPGLLDFEKFENLRLAPLQEGATPDGFVNYQEAVAAMGLDVHGLDFHIRSFPNLARVRELLEQGEKDPNLRVTYIGDIYETNTATSTALTVGSISCAVSSDRPNAYRISTSVTVPQGTTAAQLEGVFDIRLQSSGGSETRKMNSFALDTATGPETIVFSASMPFASGRSCSGGQASFDLYDVASVRLWHGTTQTLTGPAGTQLSTTGIIVDTLAEHYLPTQAIGFSYDGENLATGTPLFLTVCREDTTVATPCVPGDAAFVASHGFTAASGNGNQVREVLLSASTQEPDGKLAAGEYTVRLYVGASASAVFTRAEERLLVVDATPPEYSVGAPAPSGGFVFGDAVAPEVGFLEDLVTNFCPSLWNEYVPRGDGNAPWSDDLLEWRDWTGATGPSQSGSWDIRCGTAQNAQGVLQPGDVFPMERNVLKNDLRLRLLNADGTANLDLVNILIVGSNVDHQMLTSNQVKDTIATWVEGGGTLMVFGSADQRLEWLQSVFHIATSDTSSNGIAVPDSSHPVLHTGDDLAYNEYTHNQRTWTFKQNGANADIEDYFTHVVVGDNGDPVLTISDPGAFGRGSVILTTWLPYDLLAGDDALDCVPPSPSQGCLLMNNLLMQGYRDLFLDYGPVIPELGHDVIPAVRKATLWHPELGPIPLDVLVYVF